MAAITRRAFLGTLGTAAAAASCLPLTRRYGETSQAPRAKRLVIFHTPCGVYPSLWSPPRVAAVDDFDFNVMNEPLAAVRDRLVLVEGLSFASAYANHDGGNRAALTGGGLTSVDHYIADKLAADGVHTKLPALMLGVQANNPNDGGSVSFRDGRPVADLLSSPADAFAVAFGGGTQNVSDANLLAAQRQRILQLSSGRLQTLKRLSGAAQTAKIDTHLQGLRAMMTNLATPPPAACSTPPMPSAIDPINPDNYGRLGQDQMALLIAALACDVTRVATLQWSVTRSPAYFGSIDGEMTEAHHALSHERGTPWLVNQLVEVERWYTQQFVSLIRGLASTQAPGSAHSLLDETLVVWARELGDGHFHTQFSVSYVLAGPPGVLRQSPNGRYLHFGGHEPMHRSDAILAPRAHDAAFGSHPTDAKLRMPRRGQRHQRLLLWLCEAMGITNHTDFGSTAAAVDGGPEPQGDVHTALPGLSL